MKSSIAFCVAALAALAFSATTSAAKAGLYSGRYPLTITRSTGTSHFDGQYCLVLTDDGSLGFAHSGEASMAGVGAISGSFYIIGHTLLATLIQPGGNGLDDSLVFSAPARDGSFGGGVFGQVYGEASTVAKVTFGDKGGC